jgi:antirestriction protein ArdC
MNNTEITTETAHGAQVTDASPSRNEIATDLVASWLKTDASPSRNDVYQIVTDRVIALLEAGTVPWRKPWAGGDAQFPKNLVSGKEYRGVNIWLLSCAGFSSPYWVSYKQAQARGGSVRKGEKSSIAVFWKRFETADKATGEKKTIPMLRYYRVFNVEQCEGVEYPKPEARAVTFDSIAAAESIVAAMPGPPEITHNEARAYYQRSNDRVNMPKRETFDKGEEYYSTLFHELIHATGHESRLGRLQNDKSNFGSSTYAKEELLAEMGASYLNAQAGIVETVIDNSAAYIASWLGRLKEDRKLVVSAAAAAQRASDWILGKTYSDPAGSAKREALEIEAPTSAHVEPAAELLLFA